MNAPPAAKGDLLMLMAMLGWSGYTLMQSRTAVSASFLARVSLFAAAGAILTLPVAVFEIFSTPQLAFTPRAVAAYLFAGLVPGLLAYAGFAYLGSRFGSVRASIALYIGPIASALLSLTILGELSSLLHVTGGLFILGGVWLSVRKYLFSRRPIRQQQTQSKECGGSGNGRNWPIAAYCAAARTWSP